MDRRPATPEEARALANPLRLRILRLCLDRALTNEELAARLGKDAGSVLHHVRLLVKTGFLAAEEERRGARGSVERPYRATGKSWILDVGDEVDALRAEIAETPKDAMVTTARLGVRLTAGQAAAFEERIEALVRDLKDAHDPAGDPYGFFVAAHRRIE
jgi:DNA-binding transcriptional ArsR family regulator